MESKFTEDEKEQLVNVFETLDVKPKMDDPDALKLWMEDYLKGQGRLKTTPDPGTSTVSQAKTTHLIQTPRISPFSGIGSPKEISYESWRYEVMTLLREGNNSRQEVGTAAKKSLRGEASNAVRRLGLDSDIGDVMKKLDGIYGLVEESETLLGQFYSAKQQVGEKVASWGCRLEDLLDRANQQENLHVHSFNDMLRTKFWNGLLPHLKDAARSQKEHVKDFDQLRIEVRKIECECGTQQPEHKEPKKGQVKMVSVKPNQDSDMEKLTAVVCQLSTKLDELQCVMDDKAKVSQSPVNSNQRGYSYRRNRGGGRFRGNRRPNNNWTPNRYSGNKHGSQDQRNDNNQQDVTCYRCNQVGHLSIGCRVDLSKDPLNCQESV